MKCPVCGAGLEINIESSVLSKFILTDIEELATTKNMILKALLGYWRSEVERDYVHDSYHKNIGFLGNSTYSFHIQTHDSPEGDTWIHGKIKVTGLSSIEIVEQGVDDGVCMVF